MAEVLAEHHILYAYVPAMAENQWTCTGRECEFRSVNFSDAITHQEAMLTAAGFGLMADAKREALEEAADRFDTRSETLLKTMQNMADSREYGPDDITRYGAYSAEANTTSTYLRARAAAMRGEG
jgi:hypothetical protein